MTALLPCSAPEVVWTLSFQMDLFCFTRQLSVIPRIGSLFSCRCNLECLLICSCSIYLLPILEGACSRTLSMSILTSHSGSGSHCTIWNCISHAYSHFWLCNRIIHARTSFLFLSFKYWIIHFQLDSVSDLVMQLCKNKQTIPRNHDFG